MADSSNTYSSVCLMGIMDQLWFHQPFLFFHGPNHLPPMSPEPSPSKQEEEEEERESSPDSCPTPTNPSDKSGETEEEEDVDEYIERLSRAKNSGLTLIERRARRSCSSSPSPLSDHGCRPRRRSVKPISKTSLLMKKSMSCADLEMEEVKGFMDLGFKFKKEHLSPRMLTVVPGLQRLTISGEKHDEPGEDMQLIRPYLSEAWLIRRPDSPLLNLRVPTATSPEAEMKRHLRFWARMVASVIEQES